MHSVSFLDPFFSSVLSFLRRWLDSPENCGGELVWCGDRQTDGHQEALEVCAGVAAKTEKRYGRATEDFLRFSDAFVRHVPNSAAELLGFLSGEHVNHCHADDIPLQNAVDSSAEVRKYLPAWRDSTTIGRCFLRNWSRTKTINHALPLPCNVIEAMTGLALLQGNLSLAGAL